MLGRKADRLRMNMGKMHKVVLGGFVMGQVVNSRELVRIDQP